MRRLYWPMLCLHAVAYKSVEFVCAVIWVECMLCVCLLFSINKFFNI